MFAPPTCPSARLSRVFKLCGEVAAQFGSSGYVVDTIPLALYCAQFIVDEPLSTVVARAIEAGGDTDTSASITGQIAGTVVGAQAISGELFASISGGEEVIRVAGRFADFVNARGL